MSEYLKNRQLRQQKLKEIVMQLHHGAQVDEVKESFRDLLNQVGPSEIAQLEQALIKEGLPEDEIKRLCDVHVTLFKESLDSENNESHEAGHPLQIFRAENTAIESLIQKELRPLLRQLQETKNQTDLAELFTRWQEKHLALQEVEKHYSREENLLFPYLEKSGLTGPPSVMWSIHDDIRDQLKQVANFLEGNKNELHQDKITKYIEEAVSPLFDLILDMIYRENKVLFKFSAETLTKADWQAVKEESGEIGYTLITPQNGWTPKSDPATPSPTTPVPEGTINFETGSLSIKQIEQILNKLPIDITFVDQDNVVRYFSKPQDRIFTRTKTIIGRKVQLCHPPESIHVVNRIVEEFKAGHRDSADFWLTLGDVFVYIRYYAVRDENRQYLGVVEITQDITEIRKLEGENRLLSWE